MAFRQNNRRVSIAFSLAFAMLAILQLVFCAQAMALVARSGALADAFRRAFGETGLLKYFSDDPGLIVGMLALVNLAALALTYRVSRQCITGKGVGARTRRIEVFARSTLDALPSHVAILDDNGVVLDTNAAWREFAVACPKQGPAGDMRGTQNGENYLAVCDEAAGKGHQEAAAIAAGIRAVMAGKLPAFAQEYPIQTGALKRWFVCRVTKFPGDGAARAVVAHEDITQRRTAEEAMEKAKDEAERANTAKSNFLANMSHEIRTPMTAILGYSELLLDPRQSPGDRRQCVGTIRRNSEHLLAIINDVLDISKIEACRMSVESIPCDLPRLIGDVIALVQTRAMQKDLDLSVRLDGEIPRQIQTDPLRVKQVLVNLLGNAIKFTESGSITLTISREVQYFSHTIRFDVADTGVGMTETQIRNLFQPFTQADESTTRKFGGTGLGLTISKRLAKLLGGDIDVKSVPKKGSTFSFTFNGGPREGAALISAIDPYDLTPVERGPTVPEGSLVGNILLAEDGEDNQELLGMHLRSAGLTVTIAANGKVAVEYATSQPFDLILMDMQMPELDGYGAATALRGMGVRTPIVALTANAMAEDRGKCLAAGCTEYLAKPISRHDLLSMVSRFVGKAGGAKASQPAEKDAHDGEITLTSASRGAASSPFATDPKYGKLLERFVARLPDRVSRLVQLTRAGDLDGVRQVVHNLKGAGHGYGFAAITEIAARAEEAIRVHNAIEAVESEVGALIDLIRKVEGYDRARETDNPSEPYRDAAA